VVSLRDQREAVPGQTLDQPDLPQRLRAVEALGEDATGEQAQLLEPAGVRQRGVADVVLDVEVRVVDPERTPGLERREGQLLAVARHQVHP
jgi:hypothetical protein